MWATPPSASLDAEAPREVVLVVVERGDRRRLGAGDRDEDLELELLLALARGEHPAAAAEERVGGDVEVGVEAEPAQQLDARGRASASRQVGDRLGLAEADELALVEHLHARRVARRLVAEDVGAAGVDRHAARRPAGRARRSPGRPGSRRPASARGRSSSGTRSSPRGGWRAPAARPPRASLPSKAKTVPGEVRERLQVAARLELRRGQRPAGSAARSAPSSAPRRGDERVEAAAGRPRTSPPRP